MSGGFDCKLLFKKIILVTGAKTDNLMFLKVILISTIIMPSPELNIRGITYPLGAKIVGYIISLVPLAILIYFGAQQAIAYNYNWVKIIVLKLKKMCLLKTQLLFRKGY